MYNEEFKTKKSVITLIIKQKVPWDYLFVLKLYTRNMRGEGVGHHEYD